MAEPLYKSLQPASFRGVAFSVEMTDLTAGRRTVVHEYPQRDKPYAEDLGRATRELTFEGFVVGADYVAQANALLAALEESGSGTLVHPWFGSLTVSVLNPARVSFDAGLGRARFSLSFVEAGELAFPAAGASTQAASRLAASDLESAAVASFADVFTVSGFQDFVAAAASGQLGDLLGVVAASDVDRLLGLSNKLASSISTAVSLIADPESLGWSIAGAFGLSGLATTASAWTNAVRSLSRLSRSMTSPASSGSTPSRRQASANGGAIYGLGRQVLLAQAIGASSLIGTSADTDAAEYGAMVGARNELLAAIDQEVLSSTDAAYLALMAARGAVWSDLTRRARDSARLVSWTPPETMPALVIAYDRHEDATRDEEIVERNGIRHPGFVPAEPLLVMTR